MQAKCLRDGNLGETIVIESPPLRHYLSYLALARAPTTHSYRWRKPLRKVKVNLTKYVATEAGLRYCPAVITSKAASSKTLSL
jgi:hypothetical protein